ncbi:MAG TPA: MBL fold metallo-hydrolase [Gemmataceae bacterium]
MRLVFLGTRGEIEARTPRHGRHTALLIRHARRRVMIDCGADWAEAVRDVRPHAIVLTHAHPDHAWGLKGGAPCPVWATGACWEGIADFPIDRREHVNPREPFEVAGVRFEAFPVDHSLRAPAVGYRVAAPGGDFFYVPDVAWIPDRGAALGGVRLYIGDGATVTRSMVRRQDGKLFGHVPVRTQLTWCRKEGVPRAVFTHCGSEIVAAKDEDAVIVQIRELAAARGVEAEVAYDGMTLEV